MEPIFEAAPTPRILWIELTSKCPFDCIFCSRKTRRGSGQHLRFDTYAHLVNELVDTSKFLLNYSGESTVYPELIPAIRLARSTGATVELVSALATAPESLLAPLAASGLDRLTVSVHATDPETFAAIYRHSSFEMLKARLERFLELSRGMPDPPVVDLAFVAMDSNLAQLGPVASFARRLNLRDIFLFPVMRRDEIQACFASELTVLGGHRPDFRRRVRAAVSDAERQYPEIVFTICNEAFETEERRLGEVPVRFPGALPAGARIYSCEQNPWETTHVLANGDVVACEVLDRYPLGNLLEQSIGEIWHGAQYQHFRERYRRGEIAECQTCPWKRAYLPGPLVSEILGARGANAQLTYGWHEPAGEEHIWSSQQARATLLPRAGSRLLRVSGILPPGPHGEPNQLSVQVNGNQVGTVDNPSAGNMPFEVDFPVADCRADTWVVEFRTSYLYRPSERGPSGDRRDLGFALVLMGSLEPSNRNHYARRQAGLTELVNFVRWIDRLGRGLKRFPFLWRPAPDLAGEPGVSIIIPERDNLAELAGCLESVRRASEQWDEPLETIVMANGSDPALYWGLRGEHPGVRWLFRRRPTGFAKAVRAGLRAARYGWVYLLNNDVVLEPGALCELASYRDQRTFSIASQILLKDTTRYRDETNWGVLVIESGLATLHDWIPRSEAPVDTFYAGGGASLFHKKLLERLIDPPVYDPFYWEDAEWGWRARKLGYRSLFCPASVAHHTQHATIRRHHPASEVEAIMRRNRLLFQLRNFTSVGSLDRVVEEIARAPEALVSFFQEPRTRGRIARGRLWNQLAPVPDEEVMEQWQQAVMSSPVTS